MKFNKKVFKPTLLKKHFYSQTDVLATNKLFETNLWDFFCKKKLKKKIKNEKEENLSQKKMLNLFLN
jgi:hypothetical protein